MALEVGRDLIFDLGMHIGQDTEYYLAKGFRVVAVDANAELCEQVADRLQHHVASGALTIVNCAIAEEPGEVVLYEDEASVWSTVVGSWAARNRRLGSLQVERRVRATTTAALFAEFGVPYFLKIDIEGMDLVALRGLRSATTRPRYISIESDKVSFRNLREEFETFEELGYDSFKLVSQRDVPRQRLPHPPLEGRYVDHEFPYESSGAFGEEAPGPWLDADEAIERYRRVFLQYALTGDDPFIRSPVVRKILKGLGFRSNWFDTHARLADPTGR
jgi:FkbM family methyltransferase